MLVKPDKGSKFRKPNKPRAVIIQRKPGLGFSVMAEKWTVSPSLFHKALKPSDMVIRIDFNLYTNASLAR